MPLTESRSSRLAPWLIALVALLPHLVGLRNGFVYDDFRFFVENPGVQTLARPLELATDPGRMATPPDLDIWRPLRTLLFAAEHALFGGAPAGWHALSLLLHLLLVRAAIAWGRRLPGFTPRRALAAGLLFGVHPLTVESVAWASSQGDLLAALLVMACLVAAGERPALASAAAAVALLAKESALPLVLLLVAARSVLPAATRPRRVVIVAAAAVSLLYLLARQQVLAHGFDLSSGGFAQRDATAGEKALQFGQNVLLTVRLFLAPWPLSIDYDRNLLGAPDAFDLLLAVALLGALALLLWRRRELRQRVATPLLLAFLFFLPTSGLLVALKSPTAERFLLLPCLGLAIAAVAAPAGLAERARLRQGLRASLRLAFGAIVLLFATLTFLRTREFRSDESLWLAERARHPASLQAQLGLLNAAVERGDRGSAAPLAESILAHAATGDPRRVAALFALGQLDFAAGDDERGVRWMQRCRAEIEARGHVDDLDPQLHLAWVAIANFLRTRLGPHDAELVLRAGIDRFGRQPRLLEGLGVARAGQGDPEGAEACYREALAAGAESVTLRYHLARALVDLGRREEAKQEVARALALDPSHVLSRQLAGELGAAPLPGHADRD